MKPAVSDTHWTERSLDGNAYLDEALKIMRGVGCVFEYMQERQAKLKMKNSMRLVDQTLRKFESIFNGMFGKRGPAKLYIPERWNEFVL